MFPAVAASLVRGPNLVILSFVVAWQGVLPFIPIAGQRLGMDAATIGLLIGLQGVAGLLVVFPTGAWLGRLGAHRLALWGAAGGFGAFLALWAVPTVPTFFAVLPLIGAFQMVMFMAGQMLVVSIPDTRLRDQSVGMFMFYTSVGVTLGPVLGALAVKAAGGLGGAFLVGVAASGLALASAPLLRPPGSSAGAAPDHVWRAIVPFTHPLKVSLLATAVGDFFYIAWAILLPLAMVAAGHTPATIGWVFAVRGAATALVRPAVGPLLSRFSKHGLTATSLGALGAGFWLSIGPSGVLGLAVVGSVVFGIGTGLVFPLSLLLITSGAAPMRIPHLLSVRQFVGKAGQIVGAVVTGALAAASQAVAIAAVAVLGLGAAAWVYARRGDGALPAARGRTPRADLPCQE
jgi:MFS family permease